MKTAICPLCQRTLSLDYPDSAKMMKLLDKAKKNAVKEAKSNKNSQPATVAGQLSGSNEVRIDENAVLHPEGVPRRVEWLLQMGSIPAVHQNLFYSAANLLSASRSVPLNMRADTRDAFVMHDDWFVRFQRNFDKRICVKELPFGDGSRSVCLLLGKEELQVTRNLHPACPYCHNLLPDEFACMTDDPVNIVLIGNPKVGKTVWQTSLYHYLTYRRSTVPDVRLMMPTWGCSTLHSSFIDMSNDFRKGIVPTWSLPEIVVPVLSDVYDPDAAGMNGTVRSDTGGARAIPLVLILENTVEGTTHRRYVCIRDFAGENLKKGFNGIASNDYFRFADAFFIFQDIFGEEIETPKDYENAAKLFTDNIPSEKPPYVSIIVPKCDKPDFSKTLCEALILHFRSVFTEVFMQYCRDAGMTPELNDVRELAATLSERYVNQSPENMAGCIFTNFEKEIAASVLSGKLPAGREAAGVSTGKPSAGQETAGVPTGKPSAGQEAAGVPTGKPPAGQEAAGAPTGKPSAGEGQTQMGVAELAELLRANPSFRARFPENDPWSYTDYLLHSFLFFNRGVREKANTHAVSFENGKNVLRQYYMRMIFSQLGKHDLLLTNNYSKFRDVSLFPVSALGMEADGRKFSYEEWDPINLTDPLYWVLLKFI